jgi:hypothetical protein
MSRFSAEHLYEQIINQVVEDARTAFTEDGLDTNVLSEVAKVHMHALYVHLLHIICDWNLVLEPMFFAFKINVNQP